VLATLVAGFLGGYTIGRPSFDFKFSGTDVHSIGEWFRQLPDMVSSMNFSNLTGVIRIPGVVAGSGLAHAFFGLMAVVASIAFTYGLAMFIIGGAIELGFDLFNVSLYTASGKPKFELLFSRFSIFGRALGLRLLMAVKVFLWSLLLIVPGIVAAYRYAMAPYLLAENPDVTAPEAIEQSKQMMSGNKGRLFCLQFSFIGWYLLAAITSGIGWVFLAPYTKAADTAFYMELTGRLPKTDASDSFGSDSGSAATFTSAGNTAAGHDQPERI
jgi:uncharacterized membrane protein